MEPPAVALEREALEPALVSEIKPPGASLRWRWSSPASLSILPGDVPPPWLSPARAAPPPAVAPAPAPARDASAEVEEYSSWNGAAQWLAPGCLLCPAHARRAALPEELLEAVMRLLDAQLRDWPERSSLLAVRRACDATPVTAT